MILAIESTCDETAAAMVGLTKGKIIIHSKVVASSSLMHIKYGGIVPEVAAREQVRVIIPVIEEAMSSAGIKREQLEAIAVSYGPGLVGSLLIGLETAKTLAMAWELPLIPVDHMKAHVLANLIEVDKSDYRLPALALVVSGGHTDWYEVSKELEFTWLGGTRDDAVGEVFDKAARVLSLGYPGGPAIEAAASEYGGGEFYLPKIMPGSKEAEVSFSGIKSAVVRGMEEGIDPKRLAWELQERVVEILTRVSKRLIGKQEGLWLAGGVAANKRLRGAMAELARDSGLSFTAPDFSYCTDNAAMIGAAALVIGKESREYLNLRPEPSLAIE